MRRWLKRIGLWVSGRRPEWHRRLAERGLDPVVLRELTRRDELEAAWRACPRVDWAVEMAVVARVEPAVIEDGLSCVLDVLETWGIRDWKPPSGPPELGTLGPELLRCVDWNPEVRAALLEVKGARRRGHTVFLRASDTYDAVHRDAHRALADAFRQGVPVAALRVVLEERGAHPYR